MGEGVKAAGALMWEAGKAAAPVVGEGLKAAAPVVGEGVKMAGSAALEVGKAAAPIVAEGAGKLVNALGGVVIEGARGAWNAAASSGDPASALAQAVAAQQGAWVPLCCKTGSCLQGAAACPAPPP